MKFIDEVKITVEAGNGGSGCLSFRREKFIPKGGPDGGDGGDGGCIYLQADSHINTLVDYRYQRFHKASNGRPGEGRLRSGKKGEDLVLSVPVGTVVYDADTEELIGDLTVSGQQLLVAQGGFHGLGNNRYKSSVNRAPRQTSPGTPGERRELRLELKLLADDGLLGFPNAGKSTLINQVSNARPKIADYPFTTLYPNLGVVRIEGYRSFVIADIPGLIEGASEGAGLGIRFLKHLSRTQLMLHLVDVAPADAKDPAESVRAIYQELQQFDAALAGKPRWLVFNKIDLLDDEARQQVVDAAVNELQWTGPVYQISAVTGEGTERLCQDIMSWIECPEEDR